MKEELLGLYEGAKVFLGEMERMKTGGQEEEGQGGGKEAREKEEGKMVLSLGATPTATAIQNLVWEEENETTEAVRKYRDILKQVQENFEVEFHAGVYPGMSVFFFFLFFYFLIVHHLEDSLLTHDDTHTSHGYATARDPGTTASESHLGPESTVILRSGLSHTRRSGEFVL